MSLSQWLLQPDLNHLNTSTLPTAPPHSRLLPQTTPTLCHTLTWWCLHPRKALSVWGETGWSSCPCRSPLARKPRWTLQHTQPQDSNSTLYSSEDPLFPSSVKKLLSLSWVKDILKRHVLFISPFKLCSELVHKFYSWSSSNATASS